MLKKIIGIGALLLLTQVTYAGKVYLGMDIGMRTNTSSVSNARLAEFDLALGYSTAYSQSIYLAGELFAGTKIFSISDNSNSDESVATKYTYGGSLLPGFWVSDYALFYLRLGVASSRFVGTDGTVFGAQIGLGFQTTLSECWDMRAEYDYTTYESVSTNVSRPKTDQYKLGFIYKFA